MILVSNLTTRKKYLCYLKTYTVGKSGDRQVEMDFISELLGT